MTLCHLTPNYKSRRPVTHLEIYFSEPTFRWSNKNDNRKTNLGRQRFTSSHKIHPALNYCKSQTHNRGLAICKSINHFIATVRNILCYEKHFHWYLSLLTKWMAFVPILFAGQTILRIIIQYYVNMILLICQALVKYNPKIKKSTVISKKSK